MPHRSFSFLMGLAMLAAPPFALHAETPEPQTALINRDAAAYSEGTGKIYLVDPFHDNVVVLTSSKQPSTIRVGVNPTALALNHHTERVYVVDSGNRSVSIIDGRTDKVLATVPTAARPYAIAVDEVANRIYVTNIFSNMLTVIDGATNAVSNLRTGSFDAIIPDPDRRRIYLMGYESDTITELDPETGATAKLPAGAMHLWGMARAGHTLYVSHVQDANIAAIDLETHAVRNLPTGAMPCAITVSKETGQVYVANYADGTVTILDQEKPPVTVNVAVHPQALTLDEGAGLLYVASPQQNAVTVIDTKTRQIKQSFNNLDHPYAVIFMPSNHQAYAVNLGESSFTSLKHP